MRMFASFVKKVRKETRQDIEWVIFLTDCARPLAVPVR